jgi:hypothetical protein
MKLLSFLLLATMSLTSCVGFKDDPKKWVFGEGLWVLFLVFAGGLFLTGRQTWRSYKANGRPHMGWVIFTGGLIVGLVTFILMNISNR